jgi:hypothetical protein
MAVVAKALINYLLICFNPKAVYSLGGGELRAKLIHLKFFETVLSTAVGAACVWNANAN